MPWSNGVFSRLFSWVADAAAGFDITSSRMDGDTNDIVVGLNNTLTRDGQTKPTANLPMAGFKHQGAIAASGPGEYLTLDQFQSGAVPGAGYLSSTGGTVTGALTVNGALSGGSISTGGPITANAATITGGQIIRGNLEVDGITNLGTAGLIVPGNIEITGSGAGLSVGGATLLPGGVSASGDIKAHNIAAFGGMIVSAGGLDVQGGGLEVIGNADISGTGQIANATIGTATIGTAHVTGPLNVDGDVGLAHDLTVGANVGIFGNLTVGGLINGQPPAVFLADPTAALAAGEMALLRRDDAGVSWHKVEALPPDAEGRRLLSISD